MQQPVISSLGGKVKPLKAKKAQVKEEDEDDKAHKAKVGHHRPHGGAAASQLIHDAHVSSSQLTRRPPRPSRLRSLARRAL